MIPAFAYLRVSSIGQSGEDKDGFPRQLDAIEKYAKVNDYEIRDIFRESMTGKSDFGERPALQALYKALAANGVKTILIERLDRLARTLKVSEAIIGDLQESGYTLISTCEPDVDSLDPDRVMVRQIFAAIAQREAANIVLKLRAARQRMKSKTGRCEGVKPFGSLPGEAETLQEILDRRSNFTSDQIADGLNANLIPSRSGKPWLGGTVRKILRRERKVTA
jgi:DNA invertase Pin-like site-specific DNA recombinase